MSSGDSYKSEYIIKIKIEYSYSITLKKGFLQPLNIYLVLRSIKTVIDKRIKKVRTIELKNKELF